MDPSGSTLCAFCGLPMDGTPGRERTNEHGFAEWLLDEFPAKGKVIHTVSGGRDQPIKRRWTANKLAAKTGKVCKTCNSGWMSNLEVAVRPFLGSLIRGNGRTFYKDGQRLLAAWAVKTALAMELINPDPEYRRPIDPIHYWEMARCRDRPPPRTEVWLGAWGGEPHLHHWSKEIVVQQGELDESAAYSSTLTVGHAVLQVFGHSHAEDFEVTHQGWRAQLAHKIWPYQGPVTWPPKRLMDEEGLWAFMRPFEEVPELLKTRPQR